MLLLLLLLLLLIYLTLTEVKTFTIKNNYVSVAIPLNDRDDRDDRDGMLIKVNEKKITKKRKTQWLEK